MLPRGELNAVVGEHGVQKRDNNLVLGIPGKPNTL